MACVKLTIWSCRFLKLFQVHTSKNPIHVQLPLGRFGSEPVVLRCHAVTPFQHLNLAIWVSFVSSCGRGETGSLHGVSCRWSKHFLQQCQPSSLKALKSINVFTVVIYDLAAMCYHPLLPFPFTPSIRLACLPLLSFYCKSRGGSLSFPTRFTLSLCYTWHTGYLT